MPENISRPPNTASGIVLEQGITALAEADAEHKKYKADQNRRRLRCAPQNARGPRCRPRRGTSDNRRTARRKVAEAGCDREVAPVHRVQLFVNELPGDSPRDNHGI